MALAILYLQRRDQRRVVLREVTEGNNKSAESIDSEKQADTELSPGVSPF